MLVAPVRLNVPVVKRGLLALAVVALLLLAGAPRAAAHNTSTTLGGDGSTAFLDSTHSTFTVCDNDPDGHYAFVREKDYNGNYWVGYDTNGSATGCSFYSNDFGVIAYNICVQYEGCGSPYYRSTTWGSPTW
jgi:hypothetical protein